MAEYCSLFEQRRICQRERSQRLYDPTPIPEDYSGGSFKSREEYHQVPRNRIADGERRGSGNEPEPPVSQVEERTGGADRNHLRRREMW